MKPNLIILFDGICNLCNSAVNFTIKRDKKAVIQFAAFQSEKGKEILQQYHLSTNAMQSFVFIENEKAFTQSTAALKVCRHLNGLWPLAFAFIIVPKFLRDGVYNFIAKNRYKWFGIKETCMIPTPDVKKRFLN